MTRLTDEEQYDLQCELDFLKSSHNALEASYQDLQLQHKAALAELSVLHEYMYATDYKTLHEAHQRWIREYK